jgi:hypothetical protein
MGCLSCREKRERIAQAIRETFARVVTRKTPPSPAERRQTSLAGKSPLDQYTRRFGGR